MALHAFQSDWEPAPRPTPAGAMLLAIGDIHGHLGHLDALLGVLQPEIDLAHAEGRACELVLVGDYVDRGRDSLGVLRRVLELEGRLGIPVHALRGNHDQFLIDFVMAEEPDLETLATWLLNGGGATLLALGVSEQDVAELDCRGLAAQARTGASPAILRLLERLQLHHRIGEYVFVHAGVNSSRPLAEQSPDIFLWLREPFLSGRDWRQPFAVVHGHTIRGPEVLPHRIAIDSGVYHTGVLSAVQLVDGRLRFLCVTDDAWLQAFHCLPGLAQERRFTAPRKLPLPSRSAR